MHYWYLTPHICKVSVKVYQIKSFIWSVVSSGANPHIPEEHLFQELWLLLGPWRCHQMETSSALLAICVGNSPVTGEFPVEKPVTRSFDVFFDLRLNKRLSKQSWGWWFETLSRPPLWRHCNGILHPEAGSGMGVTKAPFVNFSWSKIFDLAKVPIRFFKSHSYLSNINVLFNN